jgi:hypothetical protein
MTRLSELETGKTNQFITKLGNSGLSAEMAAEVLKHPEVVSDWVGDLQTRLIQFGFIDPPTPVTVSQANQIMGRNYHGLKGARTQLAASLSREEVMTMTKIPFSRQQLVSCRDTHILVAVVPVGVVHALVRYGRTNLLRVQAMGRAAHRTPVLGWHLIQKTPLKDSNRLKTEAQVLAVRQACRRVPEIGVMVQAIGRHFDESGEKLFEKEWVKTQLGVYTRDPYEMPHVGMSGSTVYVERYTGIEEVAVGIAVEEIPAFDLHKDSSSDEISN